ncbi:MAG: 30S ribosomal protein S15 [Dehalococcoidia bacterium]|nr:30S ribosomal protein S15 [Dehalococcoidia bacterium]
MLEMERKTDIITKFKVKEGDTGSAEVQVALLTERINQLTEHLKLHIHDSHSRCALLKLLGKQRRLLAYLHRTAPERYHSLVARLGLRKYHA